jgi:UDP-N-acetyl-D-glucosamine dehydrogenase
LALVTPSPDVWHPVGVGSRRVVVVGQGYVGLPLAVRAAEVGHNVIGLDLDPSRVAHLTAANSYVEDVSSARLRAVIAAGRYAATTTFADCLNFDVAVISVPTPLREGNPDLTFIERAARDIAPYVSCGCTVILESTTYPGTTGELLVPALEAGSGLIAGTDFYVGYSPERIDPGNTVWTLETTPKIVSGINPASLKQVEQFMSTIVLHTVPVASCHAAELSKLLENTFRHVNIALINELAVFANDLGIDIWEAVEAAATKPFGFMRFTPGPGVGGHCLPIDPSYLAWDVRRRLGRSFRFIELANDINDHMPDYVVQRLILGLNDHGKSIRGTRILLLGLAYKKNTGDARESPSAKVAQLLMDLGAEVHAADPHVVEDHVDARIKLVDLTAEVARDYDAAVLLTDHDAFDYAALSPIPLVLDTRNAMPASPQRHVL